MSTIEHEGGHAPSTPTARPLWQLPAARAVPAVVVGIAVTFLQSHAAAVGLVALAVLAAATGAVLLGLRGAVFAQVARWPIVAGIASLVAAVAAAVLLLVAPTIEAFAIVAAAWALVSGGAEAWGAWTMRRTADPRARRIALDWRSVAILTVVVGIALAALPRNEVVLVGLLGAYAILVGVFHGIAAASARMTSRSAA